MAQPSPAPPAPNGQAGFRVGRPSGVEVLGQEFDHALARVAVGPQEGVIIANAVEALADCLLREAVPFVARCKTLDGPFLAFDLSLYFAPRTAFGVNLFCCDYHKLVSEELERIVRFQNAVHRFDRAYTRKIKEVLNLR
jgi:hypothetical protein